MKLKLRTIISEFISSADLSEHQFMRLWNIGVRGAREFNMDICGNFKTVVLPVNDNKTVDFPKDFLTFSKLGIINDFGEIVPLTVNKNLSTLHASYLSKLTVPELTGFSSPTQFPYYWFNFYGGTSAGYHLYGLPGGTPVIAQYNIDEDAKTIYLSDNWAYDSIIFEYLSDGYDCDGEDYMVDVKASEAMVAFIAWNNAKHLTKKFSAGQVRELKAEYYNQRRLARLRLNSVDISQMQQEFRSKVKLVAKA